MSCHTGTIPRDGKLRFVPPVKGISGKELNETLAQHPSLVQSISGKPLVSVLKSGRAGRKRLLRRIQDSLS